MESLRATTRSLAAPTKTCGRSTSENIRSMFEWKVMDLRKVVCSQNGRQMLLLGLLDTANFQLGHAAVALASLVAHSCESKARLLQASYFTYWEVVPLPSSGLRDSKRLETPVASTRLQRLASTLRCSRKQPSLPAWASRSLAQGLLRRRACPSSQGRP